MSAYQDFLQTRCTETLPALKDFYADDFRIGFAVAPHWLFRPECDAAIRRHASTLTAENNMKPERLLDRAATLAAGSEVRAVFDFRPAAQLLDYARDRGIPVRFHTLVWHNQTPRWFFTQGWSDAPDAPLADRETMAARLQHSIADTMDHINRHWPGLVYAWDVVNEAIEPEHQAPNSFRTRSLWYQTLGEDFVTLAFRIARQHQAEGQKLYYNDYNVAMPDKTPAIHALVSRLHAEGLMDGVGFQTHIGIDYPDFADYEQSVRAFAAMGLTIQATEMDIRTGSAAPAAQMQLAMRYRDYFAMMRRLRREGIDIDSITLWGLADDHSWLMAAHWNGPNYPLLFDGLMRPKPAFFGALLDETIPACLADVAEPDVLEPETMLSPLPADHSAPDALSASDFLPATAVSRLAGVVLLEAPFGRVLYSQVAQGWALLRQVDFGKSGVTSLTMRYVSACDCPLSLRLDDVHAAPAAELTLPHNGFRGSVMQSVTLTLPNPLHGVHDLYIVFGTPAVLAAGWQFS